MSKIREQLGSVCLYASAVCGIMSIATVVAGGDTDGVIPVYMEEFDTDWTSAHPLTIDVPLPTEWEEDATTLTLVVTATSMMDAMVTNSTSPWGCSLQGDMTITIGRMNWDSTLVVQSIQSPDTPKNKWIQGDWAVSNTIVLTLTEEEWSGKRQMTIETSPSIGIANGAVHAGNRRLFGIVNATFN